MKCPKCNHNNSDTSKYCSRCGNKLETYLYACANRDCSEYGKDVSELKARFCHQCGQPIINPACSINGREYVDLGLKVKWAACNLGARYPEEYGNYYAWGEIEPKIEYSDLNSKTFSKDILDISNTYSNDAAKSNWEIGWRMPSKEETEELIEKCTWYWIMQKGIRGYRVVGPNGNSIFLPATGYRSFRDNYNDGIMGYIWTSSYDKNNNISASCFCYDRLDRWVDNSFYRYLGATIRPVSYR